MSRTLLPAAALRRFGFRQTLKGAIIIGLFAGAIAAIQGIGYATAYPDATSRAEFAVSIESAPALGILYGEPKNLISAEGYMVYRTVIVLALISAIWGLATTTKLLRGQEEDGRLEQILAGNTSTPHATLNLLVGFLGSLVVAIAIATALIMTTNFSSEIDLSISSSIFIALAMFLPALLFASLGVLTSQLSTSRRRTFLYGLGILVTFFGIRAVGNTIEGVEWIKNLTPFGWSDLFSPIVDPQLIWSVPFLFGAALLLIFGVTLASRRDLGEGLFKESDTATSRYTLLGSPAQLAIRQNIGLFIGWGVLAVTISLLVIAVTNVAAEALADAQGLTTIIKQFGGSIEDIKIAFIGTGMVFTVMVLLIMAAVSIASLRSDEARNYLDAILAHPISRKSWLLTRLLIITIVFILISIICATATWVLAGMQGIAIELGNFLLVSIALTGTVIFTLGVGTLLYGFLPRIASAGMYLIIVWSFLIDALGSAVKLDSWLVNSSLFHYISLSPTAAPDWQTFIWLTLLGIIMIAIGTFAFERRDIITE